MTRILAVLASISAVGCILPDIDLTGRSCPCTDGYVCDATTQTCVVSTNAGANGPGGAGGAGGGPVGGGGAATGGNGGSGGSGGSPPGPVVPIELVQTASGLTIRRPGCFQLEAEQARNWQLSKWFDLNSDPGATNDLSSEPVAAGQQNTDLLLDVFRADEGAGFEGAEAGSDAMVSVDPQPPVRIRFDTTYTTPSGDAVSTNYILWTSGRVGVNVTVTPAIDKTIASVFYGYASVKAPLAWTAMGLAGQQGCSFTLGGGSPSVALFTNRYSSNGFDSDHTNSNCHWGGTDVDVTVVDPFYAAQELQLFCGVPAASEIAERATAMISDEPFDALDPSSGSIVMSGTKNSLSSAFIVDQTFTLPVVVRLGAGEQHFEPGVKLEQYPASTYHVFRGSQLIASSDEPVTTEAVSVLTPGADLLVQWLGALPSSASEEDRSFLITE